MLGLISGAFGGSSATSGSGTTQSNGNSQTATETQTQNEESQSTAAPEEAGEPSGSQSATAPAAATAPARATQTPAVAPVSWASRSELVESPRAGGGDARAQAIAAQDAFLKSLIMAQLESSTEEDIQALRTRLGVESYAASRTVADDTQEMPRASMHA
ncbi:hypothetical protein M4578_04855 [Salipiger sp. P9]|uniref:hypothetical protein n=1 Tax=Salipiger pentaromativorans TaxID=2943193 RepID=UPI00215804F7|nr:hypothetical protein [Salipiger pentaromativorans]MCR8547145.1 hypothetical protein [Salipiger pentaromativorans]